MATKYGTMRQVRNSTNELESMGRVKADPYLFSQIANKGEFIKKQESLSKTLQEITAKPVEDGKRKELETHQADLEAFITKEVPEIKKPAMPSRTEMWDRPSGVVGRHTIWQRGIKDYNINGNGHVIRSKYSAFDEWKDNQRRLYGEEEDYDPDIANIERLRPEKRDKSSFADYASLRFAVGAGVSEEQFDAAVGVPDERKCKGKKASGAECGSRTLIGHPYCRHHREQFPDE